MQEIFKFNKLNTLGICHAIAGQWIRKSKIRGGTGVTDVSELGTQEYLKLVWDNAEDAYGINKNNLLGKPIEIFSFKPDRKGTGDPEIVARQLTLKWNRYFLLSVYGRKSAHSMASRLSTGTTNCVQFIDPNYSCWSFDTSVELFEFIPLHIKKHYPNLLSREFRVYSFHDK